MHLVRIACERPDALGRSLSQRDCRELSEQLKRENIVDEISPSTVGRMLDDHRLKPWRQHSWLTADKTRDPQLSEKTRDVCELYVRTLEENEAVVSIDELTNLQPRPRTAPTRPCSPDRPTRVEHTYKRDGAINLIAGFDIRTGKAYAVTAERKRQEEIILLLEKLDRELPAEKTIVHIVWDNARSHTGLKTTAWLAAHPRFRSHFTPKHCSSMNQVEQWFSIIKRKRLRIIDFADKADLSQRLHRFVEQWNERARRFKWTKQSVEKTIAWAEKAAA